MGTLKNGAVLLSAAPIVPELRRYCPEGAFVVACDAGYRHASLLGLEPDLIVGDFDSAPPPPASARTIVLPHVKDDTDTHFAARWLREQGAKRVVMLGALGGARMDHTLANLETGLFLARGGADAVLADARTELHYLLPGRPLVLPAADAGGPWKYLSLLPLGGPLTGVTLTGVYYPLREAALQPDFPLAVSNEFTEPTAALSCSGGAGLVLLTRRDGGNILP